MSPPPPPAPPRSGCAGPDVLVDVENALPARVGQKLFSSDTDILSVSDCR